jgi:rubrerythrin
MENYEGMLLQITDVLKAHNRYHMKTPDHKQAIEQIRAIVAPKGEWVHHNDDYNDWYVCSECGYGDEGEITTNFPRHCPGCGAKMKKEDSEDVSR